jgi:hypothetical protein
VLLGRDVTDDTENYLFGTFYISALRLLVFTVIIQGAAEIPPTLYIYCHSNVGVISAAPCTIMGKREEYRTLENFNGIVPFLIKDHVGYVLRNWSYFANGLL